MKQRDHDYMDTMGPPESRDQWSASLEAMKVFTLAHESMPKRVVVVALAYLVDRFCGREFAEPIWHYARRL